MENAKAQMLEKLLAVQTELKAPKSQFNQFGKYRYRNVEDILEAAKPLCAAQKALIYLCDSPEYKEGRFYVRADACFVDIETGEELRVSAYAREDDGKKGMDGAQVTGAASSYARKYALGGLLAVDDGKDSDSMEPEEEKKPDRGRAVHQDAPPLVCTDCGHAITPVARKDKTMWPPSEMAKYSRRYYGRPLCGDCMKAAAAKAKGSA